MRPTLVAGAYGVGNLGDEAMLSALLAEVGREDVLVFSRHPPETQAMHGVPAARRNARDLARSSRLVLGGGELFQPGMAWKYALLVLAARALGKPAHVRAVGVSGKLRGAEARLVRLALRRATSVSVRDERSRALLAEWRVHATREPDLATKLQPDLSHPLPREPGPLVAMNLRRTYDDARDATILAGVHEGLDALFAQRPDARVLFLAFTRHRDRPEERDDALGEALEARYPGRVRLLRDPLTPAQMLGVVARADVLVSMRFHPLVFAASAKVPALAVREYWKVEELAGELGIPMAEPGELSARLPALVRAVRGNA